MSSSDSMLSYSRRRPTGPPCNAERHRPIRHLRQSPTNRTNAERAITGSLHCTSTRDPQRLADSNTSQRSEVTDRPRDKPSGELRQRDVRAADTERCDGRRAHGTRSTSPRQARRITTGSRAMSSPVWDGPLSQSHYRRPVMSLLAWFYLAAYDALALAGLRPDRMVPSLVRGTRPGRGSDAHTIALAVCASTEWACIWYPRRVMCLQRSTVALWLLRLRGIPAERVVGYRPVPLESHAWIELNGQVIGDWQQYQTLFVTLYRT